MSGAHRLANSELAIKAKGKTGEAYLNAVEEEMTGDHAADEGSEQDNEETTDKQ